MVTFTISEQYLQVLKDLQKSPRRANYPVVFADLAKKLWEIYEGELAAALNCDKKAIFERLHRLDESANFKAHLENMLEFSEQIQKCAENELDGEWFDVGLDAMMTIASFIDEIRS